MKKISEQELRKFLREAMETPVEINAVTDPSAAETDPLNVDSIPQNKVELGVALKGVVKDLPNSDVPDLFSTIKDIVNDKLAELEGETAMDDKNNKTTTEEVVRAAVRKIVQETFRDPADVEADEEETAPSLRRRGKYKPSSTDFDPDVSFEQVAQEMGMSVAGAKQAVDKALAKAQFIAQMDPDELEILTLNSMNDYIKMLMNSGELSAADAQLLKDHPAIVRELDGFREYLSSMLKRAQRAGQKVLNPVKEAFMPPAHGDLSKFPWGGEKGYYRVMQLQKSLGPKAKITQVDSTSKSGMPTHAWVKGMNGTHLFNPQSRVWEFVPSVKEAKEIDVVSSFGEALNLDDSEASLKEFVKLALKGN